MTKFEFKQQMDKLALAFEKKMPMELLDLWWDELQRFDFKEIKAGVQHFLECDQKVFPKIGEFKSSIRSKERRTPEGSPEVKTSCHRCSSGICSSERWIGSVKASFTFRCSCPSGNSYPGLPLISPAERTIKELMARPVDFAPEPSQEEQRRIIATQLELHAPTNF